LAEEDEDDEPEDELEDEPEEEEEEEEEEESPPFSSGGSLASSTVRWWRSGSSTASLSARRLDIFGRDLTTRRQTESKEERGHKFCVTATVTCRSLAAGASLTREGPGSA